MGKNKIRNRDRQRKENTSTRDNSDSNILSTSTSTIENVETRSTSSVIDRRHLLAEPFRRKLNMPATASLKTSQTSTSTSPAPMSRMKGAQEKRDSVISSTWEGPKRHSQPKTTSAKQPWWGLEPGGWWPCRALRWTYHFFRALIRIHWTDGQTLQDLVLTLVLIGLAITGFYVVLDFLLRALPGVAAQGLEGNCSIVYVTVPGPIITVSLIGASPTNPARGTYYFSVINGTTEWLNSIAPPSRFSTLVTRTVDVTPVISSLPTTGTSSSGAVTAPSTQTPTTSALSLFSPSAPGPGATFTSSLTSGVTFESSASTGVSGSTPPTSSLALSSVSLSPLGPASSETSSLPRPINQPQRPYPSYPLSTTVVITSNGFYSTVTTLYTLVSSSNFSTGSSSSFPPVIPSSSLPGLSPNLPSSTSGGMPSQPTSELSPPLASSVLTKSTSGPVTGLASLTTSATTSLSSSVLSSASTSSSNLNLLSPSASLASSTGSSSLALSSSLPSWLTTNSSITSGSSGPASSSSTLTSSANSISTILPTSSTLSLSVSSRSALNSAFTSSSASPSDSFSTPLTSILVSSTSTGSFTQFPGTNYSSSTSRNPTSPSSALLVSNTITNSTPSSSFLRGSSTSTDGIMSIQTDTVASASHPSSGIVSPSTTTSTLTLTTTTSLVVSSPSPSALNATSLSSFRAVTKVISYGDAAVTFVFPSPDITTTMSYWTGLYPTVTGPLPSDLQTIPLTTRTERQTPLSALPSFEIFSSRSRRFKTVFEDEGTTALARRQAIPITEVLPTQALGTTMLATTTVALPDLPGPSSCGESGNFTLTFDDTVVGDDDSMLVVANGMTNPYHHLFYANGYTYVPDMWEPYPAISQPNIAMFLPLTGRLLPNTPFAGMMLPGELGAGPRASVNAYWFNAYSAYFGCALSGLEPCTLRVSGYRYDPVRKEEVLVAEQNATIPACWGYIDCHLTQVFFNDQFRALSGIQFNAYTYLLGIPQVHMVDDLQMEWYNNTCSAGILRIGHS